jgi:hypothetical protein
LPCPPFFDNFTIPRKHLLPTLNNTQKQITRRHLLVVSSVSTTNITSSASTYHDTQSTSHRYNIMRLFLLPVSTRQSLIYCERIVEQLPAGAKPKFTDRVLATAATQWAAWENKPSGWQKQVTVYGRQLLQRIPYQEWGLKSIPPANAKRLRALDSEPKLECLYPARFLDSDKVPAVLKQLAVERQSFHRRRMWQSAVIAPLMLPFALIPMYVVV